jgi:Chalcone isomerase-like
MKLKLSPSLIAAVTSMGLTLGMATSALAVEVNGVKLEDSVKVGGKDLVLNGAGARIKAVFKVYALGLYLQDKKTTVADVLAQPGPKRFKIVMLRELSGEEFGQAFLTGINKNLEKDEKTKFVNQLLKLGETFEGAPGLKKGDVIVGDWVPGTGTTFTLNGKPMVDTPLPDGQFYNALLRIWLGDKPADPILKPLLLGEKPANG